MEEITIKFDPKQLDEIMKRLSEIEEYVVRQIQEIRDEIRKE